jgi:hypothetical protein
MSLSKIVVLAAMVFEGLVYLFRVVWILWLRRWWGFCIQVNTERQETRRWKCGEGALVSTLTLLTHDLQLCIYLINR